MNNTTKMLLTVGAGLVVGADGRCGNQEEYRLQRDRDRQVQQGADGNWWVPVAAGRNQHHMTFATSERAGERAMERGQRAYVDSAPGSLSPLCSTPPFSRVCYGRSGSRSGSEGRSTDEENEVGTVKRESF